MEKEYRTMISAVDGLPIDVLITRPEGKEKAVVQLAHGMCEYKERYLPFMEYLSGNGYLCVINDHRGHGKSVRKPEDLGFFYEGGGPGLVEDLHQLTELIRKEYSDQPLYLIGHSMGSLAVRCYARKYDRDLDGLCVIGSPSANPAVSFGNALMAVLIGLKGEHAYSNLLTGAFIDSFNKPFAAEGRKNAWLNTQPEQVDAYNNDPLCGFPFTLNGYKSLLYLLKETYDPAGWQMGRPELPVRFFSGGEDPCRVNDEKFWEAVSLMKQVGYADTEGKLYSGLRHEILNEKEKATVFRDILATLDGWLKK